MTTVDLGRLTSPDCSPILATAFTAPRPIAD